MGRLALLQEIRFMRFEDVYGRYRKGRLSCEEAADLLSVSVSGFFRHRHRLAAAGAQGLYDRRLGKVAPAKRPGAHRRKRARKPMIGIMLHQDGGATPGWRVWSGI